MAELADALDLGSSVTDVGVRVPSSALKNTCGCSSMVEHQPSKLVTWVRFPSPAYVWYRKGILYEDTEKSTCIEITDLVTLCLNLL